jgi:hypothetical protein
MGAIAVGGRGTLWYLYNLWEVTNVRTAEPYHLFVAINDNVVKFYIVLLLSYNELYLFALKQRVYIK